MPPETLPDTRAITETAMAMAYDHGLDDLARRLQATMTGAPRLPRLVCAGATSAGKSRLVNVLAGRQLLSPVGDDVVTATFLVIGPADRDRAIAVLVDPETRQPRRVEIELSAIADYVSVDASYEGVVGAEVQLSSLLLPSCQIVDTPGVGGLTDAHDDITMASLRSADVLVLAISPNAPLSATELGFLRTASTVTRNVVLVMTKIDLYPEWEAVRSADLELLTEHVPDLAGIRILPVSSMLAEQAYRYRSRNPDMAEELLAESGVGDLVGELRARGVGAEVSARDAGEDLDRLLRELRAWAADRSEPAGPRDLASLTAERDRIAAFLVDTHQGALDVHRRIDELRRSARREFDIRATSLVERYLAIIDAASPGELDKVPLRLQHEIAAVFVDAVMSIDGEVGAILDGLEARIGSVAVLESVRERLGRSDAPEITGHEHSPEFATHLLPTSEQMVNSAWGLIGVVAGGSMTGPAAPFVIAIGAAAVVTIGFRQFLTSRNTTRQQSLRLWLDRAQREIDRAFDHACGNRIDHFEHVLRVEVPRVLDARVARIEDLRDRARNSESPGIDAAHVDRLIERARAAHLTQGGTRA